MSRYRWGVVPPILASVANSAALVQAPSSATLAPSELFAKVSPSVVKVIAKDEDDRPIGSGSGFVVSLQTGEDPSNSGQAAVVTAYHVVRSAVSATIDPPFDIPGLASVADPRDLEALKGIVLYVLREDKEHDIAVLSALGKAAPLALSNGESPPIGSRVFVISSPEGLTNTLSEGLVSGYRDGDTRQQWIQITAPVSPGSSGGPVLTEDGKVIGLVVAIHEAGQSLNFAVPVSALRPMLRAPFQPRAIWKGVSIRKEEKDVFGDAATELRTELCEPGIESSAPFGFSPACDAKVHAKAEEGDQLALLVEARDQYRRDSPDNCVSLATVKRAIAAKSSKWAYLAYFYLGKLTADLHICSACIVQKKSFGLDELRARCYDPAVRLLKRSTELDPKFSPSFARLAELYLETELYPEALVAAEFLVALVPNCWQAHLIRGKAFVQLERMSAAQVDFMTAQQLRPSWYDLYDEIARALEGRADRKAVDVATEGLSLPLPADQTELHNRQQKRLLLWYMTGRMYERLGELENAVRCFQEASKLSGPGFVSFSDIEERIARCRAALPGEGK